jgi:ligand-binding sensor domain-containing protein
MTDANVNMVNIGGSHCCRASGKPLLITVLVFCMACTATPSSMKSPSPIVSIATDAPNPSTTPIALPTETLTPTSTVTPRPTSTPTPTPEPDYFSAMVCDTEGNLWIGGFGGVLKFNPATEETTAYPLDRYTHNLQVSSLLVTQKEIVWTVTKGGESDSYHEMWELFRLDGEAWSKQEDIDDRDPIWPLAEGESGSLWIGSVPDCTYYYDGKKWHRYEYYTDGVPLMRSFARASDGTWWGVHTCCMITYFHQFDGETWTHNEPKPVLDTFVSEIETAQDSSLWFKGTNHLYHYDTNLVWTPYTATMTSDRDWIRTLTIALNGDVWIGTDEGQIQRFQDEVWYDVRQYTSRSIEALDSAPDGTIWAGTSDDCIIQFDRNGATGKSYRVRQLDILPDSECLN